MEAIIDKSREALAKGNVQEALDICKDTLIYQEITDKDCVFIKYMASLYEKQGKVLWGKVLGMQAALLEEPKHVIEQKLIPMEERLEELYKALQQKEREAVDKEKEICYEIAYLLSQQLRMVEACIYYARYEQLAGTTTEPSQLSILIQEYEYIERFYQALCKQENTYMVLWDEERSDAFNETILQVLAQLGKKVYCIMPSSQVNVEEVLDYDQSLIDYSLETMIEEENICRIVPKQMVKDERMDWAVKKQILESFYKKKCEQACCILLGDCTQQAKLQEDVEFYKMTQKLYVESAPRNISCWSAFYLGNYLYIAKELYGFDVVKQLETPARVKVSVVIPTRGCARTLKYTLETCLNQDYEDYEIVVSDNSEKDDESTYRLIQTFKSSKIKYFRTPHTLPLAKSFEYAFFKATGEIVFSIGSDDGLMPYAIRRIVQIMDTYKEQNLLLWQRLFYIWPDLTGTGGADMFKMPLYVSKESFALTRLSSQDIMMTTLEGFKQRQNNMYICPMVYINSAMRRKHIVKMIEATGKFLDGISQDVYTGIVNLALYDEVLFEKFPLTVAGMCEKSAGVASVIPNIGMKKYKDYVKSYNLMSEYGTLPSTVSQGRIFPQYDYTLFVYELLKVCDLNIHTKCESWRKAIDFHSLYKWIVQENYTRPKDDIFVLDKVRTCAYRNGEEIGRIFDEEVAQYKGKVELSEKPASTQVAKQYHKGIEGGWLTIDASEFGIHNIEEAIHFFMKLFGL